MISLKRESGRFSFQGGFEKCIESGAQFEGDLGEILAIVILALGAEISPYIGLREKWESP